MASRQRFKLTGKPEKPICAMESEAAGVRQPPCFYLLLICLQRAVCQATKDKSFLTELPLLPSPSAQHRHRFAGSRGSRASRADSALPLQHLVLLPPTSPTHSPNSPLNKNHSIPLHPKQYFLPPPLLRQACPVPVL